MRILFRNLIDRTDIPQTVADYQGDALFHGLRSLGCDVCEYPYAWWMYKSEKDKNSNAFSRIWGKGFTLYGLLDDVKRDERRDAADFDCGRFDLIVVNLHHSTRFKIGYIEHYINTLLDNYPTSKIAVIDGHDSTEVIPSIANKVKYFKRELTQDNITYCTPINFAIPEEKIRSQEQMWYCVKSNDFAKLVPAFQSKNTGHIQSYIYDNESEYYDDYYRSFFAFDMNKAGCDTMRHYEILANGCVPYYTNLDEIPDSTMTTYPKELVDIARLLPGVVPGIINPSLTSYDETNIKLGSDRGYIDFDKFDLDLYFKIRECLYNYTKQSLTTKSLASQFLGAMK